MATTAGFKQQCPSCEAWVPVKDTKLVGRKIDCPKCKYRFVVEDPGVEEEAQEEVVETSEPAKKPRRGEEPAKAAAAKQKPRRRAEDEEEEGEPKKAAKAGTALSPKLVLGLGAGAVAVLVLAGVSYFLFLGGDSAPAKPSPGTTPTPTPMAAAPEPAEPKAPPITDISNLLPPETEGVCNIHIADLMKTAVGRVLFELPGTFRGQALQKKLGIPVEDIDSMVQAWSFSKNWSLNVIHTSNPIKVEAVKSALRAKLAPEKIENQEYYLLEPNPWLDALGQLAFATVFQVNPARVPPRSKPYVALRIYDPRTLIFTDEDPLKTYFLKAKWKFTPPPSRAVAAAQPKAAAPPADEEAPQQGNIPRLSASIPKPKSLGGASEAGTAAPATGAAGAQAQADAGARRYLFINPGLKSMLNRVERRAPLVSLAVDTRAATGASIAPLELDTLSLKTLVDDSGIVGAALHMKDGLMLTLGMDYGDENVALKQEELLRGPAGQELVKALMAAMGCKVELLDEGGSGTSAPGAITQNRPAIPPGRPGGPKARGLGGARGGRSADGGDDPAPGGELGGAPQEQGAGGTIPGLMQGAGPLGQQQTAPKGPEKAISSVKVALQDRTVILLTINLIDQVANSKFMNTKIRERVLQQKGRLDMTVGQLGVHELAAGARMYAEAHQGQFPRGTAERKALSNRAGRPYPPDQRVSWMAELLPHLGPEPASLYGRIDHDLSWRAPENLGFASTLIPQFLGPTNNPNTWWVQYPGMSAMTAATHYVGIAGIGLDAAEYKADDPLTMNKLGVFGYDRITRIADIKDRASNTIMIAEVPPTFKRPWMAGGGATIQGVPEKGSILPFVSTQSDGKRGTYVIFADGHVGFVSENISDEAFKALCTVNGGETVIPDRDAPKVEAPEQRKLEASPTVPPPTRATKPEQKPSGR
jgi:hypothetical protein